MAAASRDIIVEIGATFSKTWSLQNADHSPFDATGYTGSAMIRENPNSKYPVASFICAWVGSPSLGVLQVTMPITITATLKEAKNIWDLLISNGTQTIRLLAGLATIVKGATHG